MTTQTHQRRSYKAIRQTGQRDRLEYRLLVAVSYLPCLAYTAIARVNGATRQTPSESVYAEALSAARAAVGYAYQV